MAYTDQKMSGGKVAAIVIVALIHIALGYAFVTGLAYQYVKKVSKEFNTFDVQPPPPPPPPDEPPPPPPDQPAAQAPPVVSPPQIVRNPNPPPQIVTTVPTPPKVFIPTPVAAPPPVVVAPPAPKPVVSRAAGIKGNPGQFFGADNYPPAAIRAGASGRVVAKLQVGTDGRVTNCDVTSSSGNSDLDSTTCRIARSRVRFTPAKDQTGAPIASTYTLPVRWVLPDN